MLTCDVVIDLVRALAWPLATVCSVYLICRKVR